jgi:hypothetical protein
MANNSYSPNRSIAPRLPAAPAEYDARFIEQYSNILRLYFNQLDNITAQQSTTYLVANLPSAAQAGVGLRSFVTDALSPVFGSTVVGGGAVNVPVYSDGTNWKVG